MCAHNVDLDYPTRMKHIEDLKELEDIIIRQRGELEHERKKLAELVKQSDNFKTTLSKLRSDTITLETSLKTVKNTPRPDPANTKKIVDIERSLIRVQEYLNRSEKTVAENVTFIADTEREIADIERNIITAENNAKGLRRDLHT